ncbi:unnamed protein product [Victoria cruziana]
MLLHSTPPSYGRSPSVSDRRSGDDVCRRNGSMRRGSRTLGELLQFVVGDARSRDAPDCNRDHALLELQAESPPRDPSLPFVLTFTNLTYRVRTRRTMPLPGAYGRRRAAALARTDSCENIGKFSETKTLLNRISGEARDGEILAVLGASGSGKSTLIDALAGRIAKGSLEGSVTLNGEPLDGRLVRSISAYVMQDDLLFPMLTVEETLSFAAEFRLPRTLSKAQKLERVQALIDQLGLRHAAKTIIGDEGHRGVSGGERRRVSIGIDIIHDPILLFLDEPTSGLDSTSAFLVVRVLQRIARTGSIVIMSIHQPSSRIVGLLDRTIFLSRGHMVYSGPPSGIPAYFSDFGHPPPENENHTEFALDLIRELEVTPGGIKRLSDFHASRTTARPSRWAASKGPTLTLREAIGESIKRGKLLPGSAASGGDPPSLPGSDSVPAFANPVWKETAILSKRSMKNAWRMPELFLVRMGAVTVTGFILATVFWRLDTTPKALQERLGFFAFAMSTMFYTCAEALPAFLQERYVFMRETAYNAYRRSSYVLSHSLVSIPALLLLSIAFAAITFWAVGLAGGIYAFLYFFAVTFASFWAGSGFVTFLSGVLAHEMLGYTVVVSCLAYFVLFSGLFISRDRMPAYWIWFHYLSLVKYPFEGVMQNEFDDPGRCFTTGMQMFDNTPLKGLSTETKTAFLNVLSGSLGMNVTAKSCVTTGLDVLKAQGITQLSKWECLWATLAWGFLFRALFYIALMLGSKNKRR